MVKTHIQAALDTRQGNGEASWGLHCNLVLFQWLGSNWKRFCNHVQNNADREPQPNMKQFCLIQIWWYIIMFAKGELSLQRKTQKSSCPSFNFTTDDPIGNLRQTFIHVPIGFDFVEPAVLPAIRRALGLVIFNPWWIMVLSKRWHSHRMPQVSNQNTLNRHQFPNRTILASNNSFQTIVVELDLVVSQSDIFLTAESFQSRQYDPVDVRGSSSSQPPTASPKLHDCGERGFTEGASDLIVDSRWIALLAGFHCWMGNQIGDTVSELASWLVS